MVNLPQIENMNSRCHGLRNQSLTHPNPHQAVYFPHIWYVRHRGYQSIAVIEQMVAVETPN